MQPEIAGRRLSVHAEAAIRERDLKLVWVEDALNDPEITMLREDVNTHYIKIIQEVNGRKLRVVVNHHVYPNKIVTIFFDRRLKGKK